jgi:glycosyltransferase involved in cell wall biosynthesis
VNPQARIAVIIPCFNDGALVQEALASIAESEPLELVVVDDASTQAATVATLAQIAEQGVAVVRHERNRGLSAARMTGLAHTAARYVFPLDADDLAVGGMLGAMADRLDQHAAAAACFGDYAEFGDAERVRVVPARLDAFRIAYRNDYPVSSLFRREALEAVGGWRDLPGEVGYEDWHLWMTLAERGLEGVHVGRGTVAYRRRIHGDRMLAGAARRHRRLYTQLRRLHPDLFAQLAAHRRTSDLGWAARRYYPLAFGARPRTGVLRRLRARTGRRVA